jgi:hypothetical protein
MCLPRRHFQLGEGDIDACLNSDNYGRRQQSVSILLAAHSHTQSCSVGYTHGIKDILILDKMINFLKRLT